MEARYSVEHINGISQKVIASAFKVSNTLGRGYLEKVYEKALTYECRKCGLLVEQQRRLVVMYDGTQVGEYVADLVVEDTILIEVKAVRSIDPAHEAQSLNYLTATGLPLCLILNFTSRVDVRRIVGPKAPAFPPYQLVPDPVDSEIDRV